MVANGEGRASTWRVLRNADGTRELWHHSTRMLVWDPADPANPDVLFYDTGWGSVSDQGGMNTAFQVLDLPIYYSRKGGAPAFINLTRKEA